VTEHPDVRSCVVVGLPDPEFGQRVHAILELDGSTDAQAVADGMAAFLSDRLSRLQASGKFRGHKRRLARRFPARFAAPCCATSAPAGLRDEPRVPDHALPRAGKGGVSPHHGTLECAYMPSYGRMTPFLRGTFKRPFAA
jgi:acyl-CoA synthetase (AMP-forming)/AMP-acid ligase II